MMRVITSVNETLWRDYAEKCTLTWQIEPDIFWEDKPHEGHRPWQNFREVYQAQKEPDFALTWQRFSHKVEAQCIAYREYRDTEQYLIWLDADVVQQKEFTYTELEQLFPQGSLCTYLGRGDNYHPETGFILYDLQHPRAGEFFEQLENIYTSGRIFELTQWHDAYVWDWVCRELDIARRDIGPGRPGEAFGRSPLRDYFLHLKGPRKSNIHTGQSPEELMRKVQK